MTNNISTVYVCSNCDAQFSKWNGRCLECGAWGTLQVQNIDKKNENKGLLKISPVETLELDKIEINKFERIKTSITEIDRVLGGGIIPGSLILLGGEPGVGKSTIVAQIADALSKNDKIIFYVSGEESAHQIKDRLERLNCNLKNIKFISEINIEKIISTVENLKPDLVIIDSIQTVYTSNLPSESGSLNQIRASAVKFLELAKSKNISIILIGHITKDGQLAGPKSLEHIVDTVIYLETDKANNFRVLRAVKNRFGSINEIGIFEMTGVGFKEITNPGGIFLELNDNKIPGTVISSIMEGSRPFLIEVQALTTKTFFGYPQRKTSGFDLNRLQVLLAVLIKRAKINLSNQDVILNIAGGIKINEPELDLAVCTAIVSSLLDQNIDRKTLILGEVGLGGEIRNVFKLEQRLLEAEKLGFEKAIIPECNIKVKKIKLIKIKNISEILNYMKK